MRLFCILLAVTGLIAQDSGTQNNEAMMKKFMEASSPDAHHLLLAKMAGTFKARGKWRMMPQQAWQKSESVVTNKMILGNRFLQTTVTGVMMGMVFEGFALLGFDKSAGKYQSIWADNFGTLMITASGAGDLENSTITTRSKFVDPLSGQPANMKSVYRIQSATQYTLTMFSYTPDGKEFLSMEYIYTKTGD
jgi:hypothetical protein